MRSGKNRNRLAGVLAALVVLAWLPNAQGADFKKEYKMQVNVGPNFYWGMGATKFAELVAQKTGGRINVKPYWGSQLLKGAQLKSAQMVANGVIECAMESTINISPVIESCNIFSLPFFINTFENVDKLERGETGKAIFAAMESKGLEPLAWGENGFRQITNSKREIKMPDDLKGLKFRVVGSPIFIDIFRQLGADPVNMNWGDATSAFQQGVVDGQENPLPNVCIPVQIWQYHKYITRWNYLIDPLIIYWSKKEFDAFPTDIQKAIREAAIEAGRFATALARAGIDDGTSLKILKDEFNHTMEIPDPVAYVESKGMVVTNLTDAQRKAFVEATKSLYDTWVPKIGEDIYKKAQADMAK
ncbi:MAG: DctP family TRAP transporter solute-binding subunit [Desulfobacterales bacterium]